MSKGGSTCWWLSSINLTSVTCFSYALNLEQYRNRNTASSRMDWKSKCFSLQINCQKKTFIHSNNVREWGTEVMFSCSSLQLVDAALPQITANKLTPAPDVWLQYTRLMHAPLFQTPLQEVPSTVLSVKLLINWMWTRLSWELSSELTLHSSGLKIQSSFETQIWLFIVFRSSIKLKFD